MKCRYVGNWTLLNPDKITNLIVKPPRFRGGFLVPGTLFSGIGSARAKFPARGGGDRLRWGGLDYYFSRIFFIWNYFLGVNPPRLGVTDVPPIHPAQGRELVSGIKKHRRGWRCFWFFMFFTSCPALRPRLGLMFFLPVFQTLLRRLLTIRPRLMPPLGLLFLQPLPDQ